MVVVNRLISELIEPDYNKEAREIDPAEFERLKASHRKFDSLDPAVINTYPGRENMIVSGSKRTRAASELGWKEYPCILVSLDPEREKEASLRLNHHNGRFRIAGLKQFKQEQLVDVGFTFQEIDEAFKLQISTAPAERLEKRTETLKPYNRVHVMLSFSPDQIGAIQPVLNELQKNRNIEIEQSAN